MWLLATSVAATDLPTGLTVELLGEIVEFDGHEGNAIQVDEGADTEAGAHALSTMGTLFHIQGQGYLPIDFDAVATDAPSSGSVAVTVTVPNGVTLGANADSEFAALTEWAVANGALSAVDVTALAPTLEF